MQFVPTQFVALFGFAVAAAISVYAWRFRGGIVARTYIGFTVTMVVFSIGMLVFLGASTPEAKFFGMVVTVVSLSSAASSILLFTLAFTGYERHIGKRTVAIVAVPPLAVLINAMLNQWTGLHWSSVTFVPNLDGTLEFVSVRSVGSVANTIYVTSILLINTALWARGLFQWRSDSSVQIAIGIGIAAPWLATWAAYTSSFNDTSALATYLALTFNLTFVGYALTRAGLLDATPVAQSLIVDQLSDGIIVINLQRRVIDANPAAAKLLNRHGESLRRVAIDNLIPDAPPIGQDRRRELAPGPDTMGRWLEETFSAFRTPRGDVIGAIVRIRDVTEQRERERALRDANDNVQAIIAAIPDLILRTRADGTILSWHNASAPTLNDHPSSGLTGNPIACLESARSAPMRDAMVKARATNQVQVIETTAIASDDQVVSLETRVAAMPGDEFLLLVRNITERKRVERLKDEFVSTVSHELRTPLTAIRGALGLLSGGVGGDLPPTATNLVAIATRSADRLVALINDLLDIQKIESGKMAFAFEHASLHQIVHDTVEANLAYAAQFGVRYHTLFAPDPITVHVDPQRLGQVLTNLLSNAAKFAPSDSVVEVAVTRGDDGWARVSVTDTGPGIPPEFRGRIFQKFQQADGSSAREKGGTGLGLSIAKAMVERMGGSISFTSEPHVATVFTVVLPMVSRSDDEQDPGETLVGSVAASSAR